MGVKDAWKALFNKQSSAPVPTRPQNGEVGFTGTPIFAGLPMVEYNPDLQFPRSTRVYEEMRRSDGQIAAVLSAVKLPIRSTKWYIDAETDTDNDTQAQEIAEFVEDNLFGGMKYSWDDHLREALLMLDFGFSVFEKVYRFDTWQGKPVVMLDKYAPRVASSIWRFPQDENYDIVAVQQINYMTGQMVDIPLDRCRVYTYQREGDNITGISMLRPAYKHWYIKDALYKIVAVGIEKTITGTPYAKIPAGISETDRQEILDALAEARVSSDSGITIPAEVELAVLEGRRSPMDAMPFIEHQDTQIARSVLAQFINLGTMSSASGGAYALGKEMVDMFVMGLEAIANSIQHEVQKDIEDLVKWNFGADAPVPKLKHKDITFRDMSQVAQALYWLGAGHVIQVDEDLEDYIRDMFGMPPIPEDALRSQQPGVVTSPNYNPTVVPTTPGVQVPTPAVGPDGKPLPNPPQPAQRRQTRQTNAQAAGPAAASANRVAATEGYHMFSECFTGPCVCGGPHYENVKHTFTEGSMCSCGQIHTFDDPTGGEQGTPAGTKRWKRDLTAYEKVVKFEDINDQWDTAETDLVKQMKDVLGKASADLQKKITQIASDNSKTLKQKLDAINALDMKYSGQYEQTLRDQNLQLFKFGQQQAAAELGVDPSDIPAPGTDIQALNAKAGALTDLQLQKAMSAVKLAAIQNLTKGVSDKALAYSMKQVSDGYLDGPDLKMSATITVSDAINAGRGSTASKAGIQGAQWSAVLDQKTCPLCEELDEKVISVDDPDFDAFQPPLHNGCRCVWVFIGKEETNVVFDWETPSGGMIKKYAHLI